MSGKCSPILELRILAFFSSSSSSSSSSSFPLILAVEVVSVCLFVCLSVRCDSEESYGSINHVHKILPLARMPREMNIVLLTIVFVFKIYSIFPPLKKASSK
jgi:hypothetical protein